MSNLLVEEFFLCWVVVSFFFIIISQKEGIVKKNELRKKFKMSRPGMHGKNKLASAHNGKKHFFFK